MSKEKGLQLPFLAVGDDLEGKTVKKKTGLLRDLNPGPLAP